MAIICDISAIITEPDYADVHSGVKKFVTGLAEISNGFDKKMVILKYVGTIAGAAG